MSKLSPEFEQLALDMEENTEIEGQEELGEAIVEEN